MHEGPRLSAKELQRRAFAGASWSTVSSVAALPLAIVTSVVLARALGPSEFARFAYLSFVVPLIVQVSDLGYTQATVRAAARAFADGDVTGTGTLSGKLTGWNLVRLPLILLAIFAVARPSAVAASVVAAYAVLVTFSSGLVVALTAENRIATAAKLSFLQAVAAGVVGSAAALAGASGTTVWAFSFASGAVAVPGWLLVANPALRRAALMPRLPRNLPRGFWSFGLVAITTSIGYLLVFSRSEVVILDALGEQHDLAVFALAYGLAQRLTTPVDTLLGALVPALTALDAAEPERLRAGFERALRFSTAGVAFLAGAALVGTALVAPLLFGPEYRGVGLAFAAVAVGSLLQSASQPYTALAHAIGRPGIALRALGVALVVDVAMAVALVPSLGLWGAVAANIAGAVTALVLTARATSGRASTRRAGVPAVRLSALAGLAALAAVLFGAAAAEIHAVAGALAAFAAGTVVFLTAAGATGGLLATNDVAVVLDNLPARLRGSRARAVLRFALRTG